MGLFRWALVIFCLFSINAYAGDYDCTGRDDLYPLFREYRNAIMGGYHSPSYYAGYFSDEWNGRSADRVNNSGGFYSTVKEVVSYVASIESGKNIRVVFDSKTEIISPGKSRLVMVAYTEPVLKKVVLGRKLRPTLVYVDYICEGGEWKIDVFNFDSRKDVIRNIVLSDPVDIFISEDEILFGEMVKDLVSLMGEAKRAEVQ